MLCDLGHVHAARKHLWDNSGVVYFLSLLQVRKGLVKENCTVALMLMCRINIGESMRLNHLPCGE